MGWKWNSSPPIWSNGMLSDHNEPTQRIKLWPKLDQIPDVAGVSRHIWMNKFVQNPNYSMYVIMFHKGPNDM